MQRKGFLTFLFLVLVLLPLQAGATRDPGPLRLARLPILVEAAYGLDEDVLESLERKVDRAVHVPMNGILNQVVYLPEKECQEALEEVMGELRRENRRAKLQEAMKPLAEKLRAHVVLLPVVEHYSQYTYMSFRWDGEDILMSDVRILLLGYDSREGKLIREQESRFYRSDYSPWGLAKTLAEECMDKVLERADVYHRLCR